MKRVNFVLVAIFLGGYLGLTSVALGVQQGVIYKAPAKTGNYCHLKFPAIREDTLSWDRPVLQDTKSAEVIDFYGPCDYDPLGKEAIENQKHQLSHERQRESSE